MILFHDLEIAADGNLILSKALFDDQAVASERNPVRVLTFDSTNWVSACADLHLGGQVELGLAEL